MKRDRKKQLLCAVLLCANILFIWGNSMLPADASNAVSDGVMGWVGWLFGLFGDLGIVILRKLAHITEFACLGLLLTWFFHLGRQEKTARLSLTLLCGMLVACVDESIQLVSPGRSSSLVDVWIDMGGLAAGMILAGIGYSILKKKH